MRDGSDLHSVDSNLNEESVQLNPDPPLTTKNALLNFYKAQGDPINEETADSVLKEYEGKELEMFEEIYGMYNMQMNDNERQTLEGIIGGQKKKPDGDDGLAQSMLGSSTQESAGTDVESVAAENDQKGGLFFPYSGPLVDSEKETVFDYVEDDDVDSLKYKPVTASSFSIQDQKRDTEAQAYYQLRDQRPDEKIVREDGRLMYESDAKEKRSKHLSAALNLSANLSNGIDTNLNLSNYYNDRGDKGYVRTLETRTAGGFSTPLRKEKDLSYAISESKKSIETRSKEIKSSVGDNVLNGYKEIVGITTGILQELGQGSLDISNPDNRALVIDTLQEMGISQLGEYTIDQIDQIMENKSKYEQAYPELVEFNGLVQSYNQLTKYTQDKNNFPELRSAANKSEALQAIADSSVGNGLLTSVGLTNTARIALKTAKSVPEFIGNLGKYSKEALGMDDYTWVNALGDVTSEFLNQPHMLTTTQSKFQQGIYVEQAEIDGFKVDIEDGKAVNVRHEDGITLKDKQLRDEIVNKYNENPSDYETSSEFKRGGIWNTVVSGATQFALQFGGAGAVKGVANKMIASATTSVATVYPQLYTDALSTLGPENAELASQYAAMVSTIVSAGSVAINPIEAGIFQSTKELGINKLKSIATRAAATGKVVTPRDLNSVVQIMTMQLKKAGYFALDVAPSVFKESVIEGGVVETAADIAGKEMVNARLEDPSKEMKYNVSKDFMDNALGELLGSGLPTIAAGGKPSNFVLDGIRQIALSGRRDEILSVTNKAEEFRRVFDIIDAVPEFKSYPESFQLDIVSSALDLAKVEASDKGDQTEVVDDSGVDVDELIAMSEEKRATRTKGSAHLTEKEARYIDSQAMRRRIASAKTGDVFKTPSGELIEIGGVDENGSMTYRIGEGEFVPFSGDNITNELQDLTGYTGDQSLADGMAPNRKFVLDEISKSAEVGSPIVKRTPPPIGEPSEETITPDVAPLSTSESVIAGVSNIDPNIQIVEHDNDQAIAEAAGQEFDEGVKINGFYDPSTNTIHVNKEATDGVDSAVIHEAVEAEVRRAKKEDPGMIDRFYDELTGMDDFTAKQEDKAQSIQQFSEAYGEASKKEAVVEYLTRVADGTITAEESPKTFQKVRDFISGILQKLGIQQKESIGIKSYAQKLANALSDQTPKQKPSPIDTAPIATDENVGDELEFSISDVNRMRIAAIMEKAVDQGFELSNDSLELLGEAFGGKDLKEVSDIQKSVLDTYVPTSKRAKNRFREWVTNSNVGQFLNSYLNLDVVARELRRQLLPSYGGDKNIIRLAEYSKGKRNQLIIEANLRKNELQNLMDQGLLTAEELNLFLDKGTDTSTWTKDEIDSVAHLTKDTIEKIESARKSIDDLSRSLISMAVKKYSFGAAYPDRRKKVEKIMDQDGWSDSAREVANQYFDMAFAYMEDGSGTDPESQQVQEAIAFEDMQEFLDTYEGNLTITPQQRELIESVNTITRKLMGDDALASVKANLGTYVSRDYRIFLDKNYTPDVALKEEWVKRRAEELFESREKYLPASKEGIVDSTHFYAAASREFDAMIEGYKRSSSISGSEFKRDTGNLKQRKDLDPLMRQILGEYTSPLDRYIATMSNLIELNEKTRFLVDLRKFAVQSDLAYPKNDPLRQLKQEGRVFKEISTLDAGFNPFSGMMVEESLHDLITNYGNVKSDNRFYRAMSRVNKFINYNKIIGNFPQSAARNLLGNLKVAVSNGYIPANITRGMGLAQATVATAYEIRNQLDKRRTADQSRQLFVGGKPLTDPSKMDKNKQRDKAMDEILAVLRESGVLDANLDINLVKKYLLKPDEVSKDIEIAKSKKAKNVLLKGARWAMERMEATFRAADDIHKINGYLVERKRYSSAMFGVPFAELSPENQDIVNIKATDIIKDVFPNFNRLGRLTRELSEFWFAGNFISFQSEALRNSWMTMQIARDELRSDNPKIRRIGLERSILKAASMASTSALAATISMSGGTKLGLALPGLSGVMADEEDKKARQSMNKIIFPWLQRANVSLRFEGDKMYVRNLSAIDPASFWTSLANAIMASDSTGEALKNTFLAAGEAFLSPTIAVDIMSQIRKGENAYGDPIARPGREVQDYFSWGIRTIGPGFIGQVMDRLAREFSWDIQQSKREKNIVGLLTGADEYKIEHHKASGFYLKDAFGHSKGLSKTRSKLAKSIAIQLDRMPNYTETEMAAVIEDDPTTKAMYKKIQDLRDDVDGFITLGIPAEVLKESIPKRYRAYLLRETEEIPRIYEDQTLIKNIQKHLTPDE